MFISPLASGALYLPLASGAPFRYRLPSPLPGRFSVQAAPRPFGSFILTSPAGDAVLVQPREVRQASFGEGFQAGRQRSSTVRQSVGWLAITASRPGWSMPVRAR
jgi:hypothetical protein